MRIAVDIVLFRYAEQQLHLLLIWRKYAPIAWALPGGFVLEEDLETAVARELREEAGVANVYLEQLYTFGGVGRDPRRRVISVAYYGLVKPEQFTLSATTDSLEAKWFWPASLPELAFDHADIIAVAHQRLQVRHLDSLVSSALRAETVATVRLYGGRDSFLATYCHYGGQFATVALPNLTDPAHCATEIRRRIGQEQRSSADIRTGLIQAWEGVGAGPGRVVPGRAVPGKVLLRPPAGLQTPQRALSLF